MLDEFGEAKGAHHSDGEASGDDESGDDESGDDVDDSSKHGKKGGTGDTAKRDGKVNKAPAEASANRKSKAAHQPKSPVPGKTNHLPKSDSSNEVYLCSPNWYERIERVEIVFVVLVNGKELSHSVDWRSPVPPNVVKMFTNETYGAAFQSPALGMYHERVKHIGHKAEDAALVAAPAASALGSVLVSVAGRASWMRRAALRDAHQGSTTSSSPVPYQTKGAVRRAHRMRPRQ